MNQTSVTSHPSFSWLRSQAIPSLQLDMHEFEHIKTGARHYHLAADNPENVFMVALRTLPMDSTGVAHILEHTALCGSEKYPVRDPFFMMIRRSLNTFMNAFTSSDCTAYPFASKNRKDFNNLLQVYLDAVFFSNLNELDFAQEGHRLAFTEPDNPNSDLQYKGVVYNEMKGAMSSATSRLWQTLTGYLFPTTTYHYNSGGEPSHIPDLSYQDLQRFYQTHYHPSNAIFMTYGDIPAHEHQENFEILALQRFEKLDIHLSDKDEKRYLAPIKVQESYSVEAEDDESTDGNTNKTHVVTAWLLGKSTDLEAQFKAQLLSSVLLDNSASPLMDILETTDLGRAPSPLCGLEDSNREMSFICGLEGCPADATNAVEKLIIDALHSIEAQGVDQAQVEAALHQLELSQREISGDSYPYGLQLIMAGLSSAVHRGDPIKLLDIESVLAHLREEVKHPDFFPGLINTLLLNNSHRVTLTLTPDANIAEREADAERRRLQTIQRSLSDAEKAAIIDLNQRLAQRQMQEDDPDVLPKIGLEDVPAELPIIDSETLDCAGSPLTWYAQGTNGLCYQQIIVDLPELENELLDVLPWYTSCYTELGVGSKTYGEAQTWQAAVSGGLNCYASVRGALHNEQQCKAILVLSSKALQSKHQDLSALMYESFFNPRFDEAKRVRELLEQINTRQLSSITGRGHSLAVALAASGLSPTAHLSYRFTGLQGIKSLKQLCAQLSDKNRKEESQNDQAITSLLARFQRLHELITQAPRRFLLIGEAQHRDALISSLNEQWQQAPATNNTTFRHFTLPPTRNTVKQLWTTNTQVHFCAKAIPTVAGGHPDHAPLTVLAGLMRNGFLHRVIREQGGAYGAGAEQDAGSASFRFYSYRDPRLLETLNDFDAAIDWAINESHNDRLLEEAILGVISGMDRSTSPAGAAKQDFYNNLFGRSRESRMIFRQQVLAVTLDDLRRVAQMYLKNENASIGVVSNNQQQNTAKKLGIEILSL
jgi:presequence protease